MAEAAHLEPGVRRPVDPQLRVRLVAREQELVGARELGEPLEEVERRLRSRRIVRVVDPDDRRACPRLRPDGLEVGQEAALLEKRQLQDLGACERGAAIRHGVTRLGRHHEPLVRGPVDDDLREQEDRLFRAVRWNDLGVGIELDAEPARAPSGDGAAELGQPFGKRIRRDLSEALREGSPDHRIGRLARVALAEVDQLDTLSGEPALRLLELDERIGTGRGEGGGQLHGRHMGILPSWRHNPEVIQRQPDPALERGFIVAVLAQGVDPEEELAELRELAHTALVEPIGELVQHRPRAERRTYVGKGKLDELKRSYRESGAESLIVDDELEPVQQRQLEDALQARVVDRTQLILDIFAQHARSAEGKLQVELAQLEYNLPRMRGLWQHLERLGGGVGTRGPGETQLESDRRLARRRILLLRRRLRGLGQQRATRRKSRRRSDTPTIALAGYTNVGKSTLLNALTGAGASVNDRLFETLDPTTRGFEVDGRRYLGTDTLGLIQRLPHQLVEGFAATLEETLAADLVLHVVDSSAPEERMEEMVDAVESVLAEVGAEELPVAVVLNKIDLADPLKQRRLA